MSGHTDAHLNESALGGELGKRLAELDRASNKVAADGKCMTYDERRAAQYAVKSMVDVMFGNLPAILAALATQEAVCEAKNSWAFDIAEQIDECAAEILADWTKS